MNKTFREFMLFYGGKKVIMAIHINVDKEQGLSKPFKVSY